MPVCSNLRITEPESLEKETAKGCSSGMCVKKCQDGFQMAGRETRPVEDTTVGLGLRIMSFEMGALTPSGRHVFDAMDRQVCIIILAVWEDCKFSRRRRNNSALRYLAMFKRACSSNTH